MGSRSNSPAHCQQGLGFIAHLCLSYCAQVCTVAAAMDVFLMIRRLKLTIFLDAMEVTTVYEVKKMVEGITGHGTKNQRLYNVDDSVLEDDKTLRDCGLTISTAMAHVPAELGLAVRDEETGKWEELVKTPYTLPPELNFDQKEAKKEAKAEEAVDKPEPRKLRSSTKK